MGKSFVRCALAIAALMPAAPPAAAWTCDEFATLATKAVNAIRDMGGCGFNLTNSFYSTNKGTHYRWCRALENSDPDAVETRLKDLTYQAAKCSYCNTYARLMSNAARDNISYGCGFDPTDRYWNPDRNYHFNGCMAYAKPYDCGFSFGCYVLSHSSLGEGPGSAQEGLDPNVGYVLQRIEECKLRHPVPKGCMSGCHGGSQSVGLPAALRPIKRGSGEHNFSIGRVPPSFKPEGTSTGANDLANPSGERRRNPRSNRGGSSSGESDQVQRGAPDPCGSNLNPCKPARVLEPGLLDSGGAGGIGGAQGPAPGGGGGAGANAPPPFMPRQGPR